MTRLTKWTVSAGVVLSFLSGCGGSYVPRVRDVSEQPLEGNYWYQQFTLYDPANPAMDCAISRTGQKLDLNSASELVNVWRTRCRGTTDHDSPSSDR